MWIENKERYRGEEGGRGQDRDKTHILFSVLFSTYFPLDSGFYALAFAYKNGDDSTPCVNAAGPIRTFLLIAHYNERVVWRFSDSMGDAIISPLYHGCKKNGVTFKFFHMVRCRAMCLLPPSFLALLPSCLFAYPLSAPLSFPSLSSSFFISLSLSLFAHHVLFVIQVQEIDVDPATRNINRIQICQQATVKNGPDNYQPFVKARKQEGRRT